MPPGARIGSEEPRSLNRITLARPVSGLHTRGSTLLHGYCTFRNDGAVREFPAATGEALRADLLDYARVVGNPHPTRIMEGLLVIQDYPMGRRGNG
jgi:hypothetical protein